MTARPHEEIESTVHYLGIEVDDALGIADKPATISNSPALSAGVRQKQLESRAR
jgi:hypothetical protein